MMFATVFMWSRLLLVATVFVGLLFLQRALAKTASRWPGLVLPVLALLGSFLVPLSFAVPPAGLTVGIVAALFFSWLLANIPTLALLAIYFVCRQKLHRRTQLNRMNIQDLD